MISKQKARFLLSAIGRTIASKAVGHILIAPYTRLENTSSIEYMSIQALCTGVSCYSTLSTSGELCLTRFTLNIRLDEALG